MRKRFVRSGRAELAVTAWPAEPGPGSATLVALHPGVGDSRIWAPCAPRWAAAGIDVVAFDRRGFGETRWEAEDHDDVTDALAVLDALAIDRVVVVGNSRGGGLALDLALEHPDRFAGLVLIAPSPAGYDYKDWPTSDAEAALDAELEAVQSAGDLDALNRLEVRYWLDGVEQPEGRVAGEARALMLDMNGRALRAGPIGAAREPSPAWPRVGEVDVPTLVVVGEHDLPGFHHVATQLVERMPDARSAAIPGSAHCPSLDQPIVLGELVGHFLRSMS